MDTHPVRLEHDPIVDCVVEMRFNPASESVSEVLPGLLFASFKDTYPDVVATPESQLPKQVRQADQVLRTKPTTLLQGPDGHIGVADEAVQLKISRPYKGWAIVQCEVEQLFRSVLKTGLIHGISRLSILYTNVISTSEDPHDLNALEVHLDIGEKLIRRPEGTMIRFEVQGHDSVSVVQIQSGATAQIQSPTLQETFSGLFLRVDTISTGKIDGLDEALATLENIHNEEKAIFFGLLTKQSAHKLGAKWSD